MGARRRSFVTAVLKEERTVPGVEALLQVQEHLAVALLEAQGIAAETIVAAEEDLAVAVQPVGHDAGDSRRPGFGSGWQAGAKVKSMGKVRKAPSAKAPTSEQEEDDLLCDASSRPDYPGVIEGQRLSDLFGSLRAIRPFPGKETVREQVGSALGMRRGASPMKRLR